MIRHRSRCQLKSGMVSEPSYFHVYGFAVSYAGSSDLAWLAAGSNYPVALYGRVLAGSRLTLIIGGSVKHAVYFQDVAIAIVSSELVSSPVETQHELAGPAPRLVAGVLVSHGGGCCWARR